jgi:hypothetical protein
VSAPGRSTSVPPPRASSGAAAPGKHLPEHPLAAVIPPAGPAACAMTVTGAYSASSVQGTACADEDVDAQCSITQGDTTYFFGTHFPRAVGVSKGYGSLSVVVGNTGTLSAVDPGCTLDVETAETSTVANDPGHFVAYFVCQHVAGIGSPTSPTTLSVEVSGTIDVPFGFCGGDC